jgi:hypothetical protein
MSAKVTLTIKEGAGQGKTFTFLSHDTFLLGRMDDCHACIQDDTFVSRHHFLLEACPPQASLRDLGSLNGTFVNDKCCGGRKTGETPEQGAKRAYPEVDLKHGDTIRVGRTVLSVGIELTIAKGAPPPFPPALPGMIKKSPDQIADQLLNLVKAKVPDEKPKLQIPGYRIEVELGRGGYGAVFGAVREKDGAQVAIKVMLPRIAVEKTAVAQFLREMEVTSKLQHPNIVRVFDMGQEGGVFYFVMEYCSGGSVWDFIHKQGGKLPLAIAKPIMLDALKGLAHAHQQGFVHRDLKPQNILLSGANARISDFGMAKNFQQAGLSGMSLTGTYAGTPLFMPREQFINFKYVKPVSDVWSLGATFYYMLTGLFPYPFTDKRDPIDVILNEQIVPLRKRHASLPKALCCVIDRALANKIQDRYPSAVELLPEVKTALP